ncbi:hypothetical protein TSUD_334250 [Trifolium subterraneum]|uniref:Uncharacterized protein n=1 Tax=Trifolium subterraneum TaxID=3900 RepID=A0A2Z6N2R0_TRISU|nr:hypothetical protein TSUD_334250 [Trifolium subterraneum]
MMMIGGCSGLTFSRLWKYDQVLVCDVVDMDGSCRENGTEAEMMGCYCTDAVIFYIAGSTTSPI